MRTIALEEHYGTPELLAATGLDVSWLPGRPDQRLCDLGGDRLRRMDDAGIDVQVLSAVTPAVQALPADRAIPLAQSLNTELAESIVAGTPDRFSGFATLPTGDPDAASRELERSVRELGLLGAMIHGATGGVFLDDPRFEGLLRTAADLDVPIYLHPEYPTDTIRTAYYSGLPGSVGPALETAGMGWHFEVGLHLVRMITQGVFDRIPGLRIIIGHLGEGLPFYSQRLDDFVSALDTDIAHPVSWYLRNHIWVTTSGFFYDGPFALAAETFGLDRMMFSVDYPFSDNTRAREWFDRLDLTATDRAAISHSTAEAVLGLPSAR